MTMDCTRKGSVFALTTALALYSSTVAADQKPEVQRLFQSGAYEQAADAAKDGDPATIFVAAQALMKGDRSDRAAAEFGRLRASDNSAWRLMGESGEALIANDAARAVDLARKAVEADGGNSFAQFQLGLAASKANDWGTAASALTRSVELKPDFAYAHYYAALAYQRQRQLPKVAEHFDAFLRLAPDAPERAAVQAVMRSLK